MRTTTKKAPVLRSKAKTAYALLSEVARLIRAEPKRYYQGTFMERRAKGDTAPKGFPPCGTVACIAGWVVVLKGPKQVEYQDVELMAQDILGPTLDTSRLFFGGSCQGTLAQTAAHAKAGAANIRAFQKAHKAQLMAKRV